MTLSFDEIFSFSNCLFVKDYTFYCVAVSVLQDHVLMLVQFMMTQDISNKT